MSRPYRLPPIGRAHAIPLSRVAQTSMWQCLIDVYRSLGAGIVLLDSRFSVVSMPPKGAGGTAPEHMELDDDAKRRLSRACADQRAIMLSAGERVVSCTPVVQGAMTVGAVLVSAEPARLDETQLLRAGAVLARAIEDELIESHADAALLSRRVATLHQLLHASADHGPTRDVVDQFAEALSVWEDAEVFGYSTDLNGQHRLEVALPGSDRSSVPPLIESGRVPWEAMLLPLSRADKEELGFRSTGDTVLAAATPDAATWMIAINVEAYSPERFELYLAALRVALPVSLGRESARLTWAMMQHFVEAASPEQGAVSAVGALTAAVGAPARLSVWDQSGHLVIAIGGALREDEQTPARDAERLCARLTTPGGLTAVLDVHATEQRNFSARELTLFDAGLDNIRTWLATAVAHTAGRTDRRHVRRSFEEIVERYVRHPRGTHDAALILISAADASAPPQTTHEWIRHVRPQLRPTDLAGRLASGDVAVLALDTPPAGALAVAHRIAQILRETGQTGRPVVRVGTAKAASEWSGTAAVIDRSRLQVVDSSPAGR